MFTHFDRRQAQAALACAALGLGVAFLSFQVGCSSNPSSYDNPAPSISAFSTGTMVNGIFTPTPTGTPYQIAANGSAWVKANFGVNNGTAVITPGNIPVLSNVPTQITNIATTTVYTLTVTAGDGKKATSTLTVNVLQPPSSLSFANEDATYYAEVPITANTPTVTGDTPMTYSVTPALPNGLNLNATSGAITGTPSATSAKAAYTVTATNVVGSTTREIQIGVSATPITFAITPSTITLGQGSILSWNANQVAGVFTGNVSISASPADTSLSAGPFGLTGTTNISPAIEGNYIYTLSATTSTGGTVTRTVGLSVGAAPVGITTFSATPTVVPFGDPTTLSWSLNGIPTSLTLNGENVLGSASVSRIPAHRQTFTLVGSNAVGSDSKQTTAAARGLDLVVGKPGGNGSRDGQSEWASFNNPQSIAADSDGNLYVAEINNNMFRKITPSGLVTTLAGSAAAAQGSDNGTAGNPLTATFKQPRGIYPDNQGYIWLCDSGNGLLRVITPAKDVMRVSGFGIFPVPGTTTTSPNQIVITSNDGTTAVGYIADYKAGLVKVTINLATMAATTQTIAGFTQPSGICADANGIVYVADTGNKAIKAIKNDTVTVLSGHGLTFELPYGVAALTSGTTSYVLVADPGASTPVSANQVYRITVDNSGATPTATAGISLAGSTTLGTTDGTGDAATFSGPQGIVVVGTAAYVVDSKNRVMTVPASLPATSAASIYSNTVRLLTNVKDAAANSQVTVTTFAGASRAAAVGKIPASGTCTLSEARFNNPQGLAVDMNGDTYLADTGNGRIVRVTKAGAVSNFPNDGASFSTPIMVAVDNSLNVYVLERTATTNTLKKIAADGTVSTITTSAPLGAACGSIAVDPAGTYLYVTDTTLVKRITLTDGTVTPSTATFTKLVGITLDDSGAIYVVDQSTLKMISSIAGTSSTVVGLTTSGFLDGDAATAKLNQPNGIAFVKDGSQGYLFVSDFYNSAIRQVTLGATPTVSTVIGKPNSTNSTAGSLGSIPGRANDQALLSNPEGGLNRPQAIAVTPSGDLLISTNETVMQFTAPLNK